MYEKSLLNTIQEPFCCTIHNWQYCTKPKYIGELYDYPKTWLSENYFTILCPPSISVNRVAPVVIALMASLDLHSHPVPPGYLYYLSWHSPMPRSAMSADDPAAFCDDWVTFEFKSDVVPYGLISSSTGPIAGLEKAEVLLSPTLSFLKM